MGMIKFNAPALPLPEREYNKVQQEQLIRTLKNYFSLLDSNTPIQAEYFKGRGDQLVQPYAMLISSEDQSNAGIYSENLIRFDTPQLTNGITVEDNTKIYVPYAGQYLVTFTLQVTSQDNTVAEFEVWAKHSGVNYPDSNTRFDVPPRKSSTVWSHVVPAVTGIFTVEEPSTEYLQLAWWSYSLKVYLEHYAPSTLPTRPAIPSVILTINLVSALP